MLSKSISLDPRHQPSPLSALIHRTILSPALLTLSLKIKQLETTSAPPPNPLESHKKANHRPLVLIHLFLTDKIMAIIFSHHFPVLLMYPGAL